MKLWSHGVRVLWSYRVIELWSQSYGVRQLWSQEVIESWSHGMRGHNVDNKISRTPKKTVTILKLKCRTNH